MINELDAEPIRRRLPGAQRRAAILETSADLFGRDGYHQATIAALAAAAGVSAPVLYAHFANKEELYLAVLHSEARRFGEHVAAYTSPATVRLQDRILGTARGAVSFMRARPLAWQLLREPPAGEPTLVAAHRGVRDAIVASAAEITASDPDFQPPLGIRRAAAASLFGELQWSSFESLADWASRHPMMAMDDLLAIFMDFAWVGLERFRSGEHWRGSSSDLTPGRPA